jgi:large subunit ribosomal protein L4
MVKNTKIKTKTTRVKQPVTKQVVKVTKSASAVLKNSVSLTAPVFDVKGAKIGTTKLPAELFAIPFNKALIAQAVRVYLANQRRGGAHTKTRGEVTGSRKKIWRQKGTGRARHGDRYAPIFVGGGIAHGPRKRDFSLELSKSQRQKACMISLSEQYRQGNIVFVDFAGKYPSKTKQMLNVLEKLQVPVKHGKLLKNILLVTDTYEKILVQAGRNIEQLVFETAMQMTAYTTLSAYKIIMTKQSILKLEGRMKKHD